MMKSMKQRVEARSFQKQAKPACIWAYVYLHVHILIALLPMGICSYHLSQVGLGLSSKNYSEMMRVVTTETLYMNF